MTILENIRFIILMKITIVKEYKDIKVKFTNLPI